MTPDEIRAFLARAFPLFHAEHRSNPDGWSFFLGLPDRGRSSNRILRATRSSPRAITKLKLAVSSREGPEYEIDFEGGKAQLRALVEQELALYTGTTVSSSRTSEPTVVDTSKSINDLLETLRRYGFRIETSDTGHTTTVSRAGIEYGYIKPYVRHSHGVLGYHLAPLGINSQQCAIADASDLVRLFCERHRCDSSKVYFKSLGPAKGRGLLIIKHPEVALRALLHDSGLIPYPNKDVTTPPEAEEYTLRRNTVADAVRLFSEGDVTAQLGVNSDVANDLVEILSEQNTRQTDAKAMITARLGQGAFRISVLRLWDDRCSVTGSSTVEAIRASHIKPWCKSNDQERLDPNNGLPLLATLDALFDAGLISFDSSGMLLLSGRLSACEQQLLGVTGPSPQLRKKPSASTAEYLDYHYKYVFRK